MNIIMQMQEGDGYTYSATTVLAVSAESVKDAQDNFDAVYCQCLVDNKPFEFANIWFCLDDLDRNGVPMFMTVDEFFTDAVAV